MAKIYSQLENLFKFRILNNSDISSYLKRLTNMGKLDEVKKIALFNIILTRLGEIEDQEITIAPTNSVPHFTTAGTPAITTGEVTFGSTITGIAPTATSVNIKIYECADCDLAFDHPLSLGRHRKKEHKKQPLK